MLVAGLLMLMVTAHHLPTRAEIASPTGPADEIHSSCLTDNPY
jgi:hypothetical protein